MLKELIQKTRTYRRFYQDQPIPTDELKEWVDYARCSASGANMQPLKYLICNGPEINELIFNHVYWAGYLKDWEGPIEGERPTAYIVILGDTKISKSFGVDHGIAAQSIMLGATEKGFGGCMMGAINRKDLHPLLPIDPSYEILLILALGKPKQGYN